jgi:hypothetical protein
VVHGDQERRLARGALGPVLHDLGELRGFLPGELVPAQKAPADASGAYRLLVAGGALGVQRDHEELAHLLLQSQAGARGRGGEQGGEEEGAHG